MIFKKKYVRSEWFEGLLEAEEFIKDGYIFNQKGGYMWFTTQHSSIGVPVSANMQRILGIRNYMDYYENKLKVSNENP